MMNQETDVLTLRKADWKGTEQEVVAKLRALQQLVQRMPVSPANDAFCNEAIFPLLKIIGDFCTRITVSKETISICYTPSDDNDPGQLPDHGRDIK